MRPDQAREPLERFVDHIEFTETCWLWTGKMQKFGYGQFALKRDKLVAAHRFAYEAMVRPIPEGLVLDHLCRVRNCVRPDHLEPVTARENSLRGDTVGAKNAAKTHCPRGHAYDHVTNQGKRVCRTCIRERDRIAHRERYQRKKSSLSTLLK